MHLYPRESRCLWNAANLVVQPLAPPDLQMNPSAAHSIRALIVASAALPVQVGVQIHRWHTNPPQPARGHTCH